MATDTLKLDATITARVEQILGQAQLKADFVQFDGSSVKARFADTDQQAVLAWLARFADSPNTLANARREGPLPRQHGADLATGQAQVAEHAELPSPRRGHGASWVGT